MHWTRGRGRRFGSWLSLAAVALQIALSFGHVHLDGVRPANLRLASDQTGSAAAAIAPASVQRLHTLPAGQPGDDDDGYCAICATIYFAAHSFVPEPPHLPALFVSRPIEHCVRVAAALGTPRRTPFQSRAPPLA